MSTAQNQKKRRNETCERGSKKGISTVVTGRPFLTLEMCPSELAFLQGALHFAGLLLKTGLREIVLDILVARIGYTSLEGDLNNKLDKLQTYVSMFSEGLSFDWQGEMTLLEAHNQLFAAWSPSSQEIISPFYTLRMKADILELKATKELLNVLLAGVKLLNTILKSGVAELAEMVGWHQKENYIHGLNLLEAIKQELCAPSCISAMIAQGQALNDVLSDIIRGEGSKKMIMSVVAPNHDSLLL